jgi:predicted RNA-binding protein YlqC (UPF0109 family)
LPASFEPLLQYLVQGLVDRPDQVELRAKDVEGGRIYELKVAPEDVGKVIGRDGRTVHALRTVLSTAAGTQGEKARLEILDDRRPPSPEGAAEPTPQ